MMRAGERERGEMGGSEAHSQVGEQERKKG